MKNYKKVIAGAVAIAISAGATTTLAFAKTNDGSEPDNSETAATAASDSTSSRTELDKAPYKDETVYVLCKNDSHIKKVIVSDWLQNPPALSILDDVTSLKDIENVKGEETFTTDSDKPVIVVETSFQPPMKGPALTSIVFQEMPDAEAYDIKTSTKRYPNRLNMSSI